MRFTFLGTGTSAGVPLIACSCAVCTSSDERDKRLRTGACVQFVDAGGQERTILIDTTPDLRQQALRAGLTRCDAVIYTHNHVDHTFGLDEVRRFNAAQKSPIDVYAEAHTLDHLRRVYRHIFEAAHNVNQSFVATLIAHEIGPEKPIDLFGVRFTPIRLLHGRLPVLGFRIERQDSGPQDSGPFPLAYCTDVSAIPPESWRLLRGVNTLVLDALRPRHHPTHFTLDQAINVAERVGAPRTYFIHMSHDLGHAETNAALPEGVQLAHDGLVLG
ncbi:MAG: MBL fold metallo-hydrolase [Phycisphaeraceae bacterium]|nr:MBL fold metallo-hydrolase [Phycisphaeraceae bacterium]